MSFKLDLDLSASDHKPGADESAPAKNFVFSQFSTILVHLVLYQARPTLTAPYNYY